MAPADPRRRALAVGIVLAVTTFAFDGLAITTAMPEVVRDLGGVSLYGAAFSAFAVTMIASIAVSGPLADRHGPRPVLLAGLVVFSVGLALGGLAPSMVVVVVSRAVQGIGAGTIGATVYVIIGRAWAPDERARMFAVLSAAWVVPGLVAPGAAGLVADHLSWRWVFLGLLPFPIVSILLAAPALASLPAIPRDEQPRPGEGEDTLRRKAGAAVALAAGTGVVLAGFDREDVRLLVPLVVAGLALGVPAALRLLPPGTTSARPLLPALVAVRLLLNWAFFGTDFFVPYLVTEARGSTTLVAGLSLTTSSLGWTLAAWWQARPDHPSTRNAVLLGFALIAAGTAGVAVCASDHVPLAVVGAAWAVAGAGMGMAFNATSVTALGSAPPGAEGVTSSALQVADSLGVALATGLGGALIATGDRQGWDPAVAVLSVFALAAAAVLPGALAGRRLPRRDPEPVNPEAVHAA